MPIDPPQARLRHALRPLPGQRACIVTSRVWLACCAVFASAAAHAAESAPAAGIVAPPAGFVALWDGTSLAQWQGGSTRDPRRITPDQQAGWDNELEAHWQVEQGELVSDGHGPHLATRREYGDFELWVDWKLSPNGDSGIYLRGCPQVQLWDPENEPAHQHGADKGSGGLWNNQQAERFPLVKADRPTGEWNRMYVRMVGPYVTVILNNQLVVDNVILENYFDRAAPVFARGTIHLQTHGSETRFRNLFVREIGSDEANALLAKFGGDDEAFQPLTGSAGATSANLDPWVGAVANYEAVGDEIRCLPGKGGNLVTAKQYADYVVRLEFKLPPGGNNGLAIRTPGPDVDAAYAGLELQVLDNNAEKYADLKPHQFHGSIYGLQAAYRGYLRPVGEWNYQEVVVDGDRIEVHLNGYPILVGDLAALRSEEPGNKHEGLKRTTGHFGFCGHGDPVAFRRVRIKTL